MNLLSRIFNRVFGEEKPVLSRDWREFVQSEQDRDEKSKNTQKYIRKLGKISGKHKQ